MITIGQARVHYEGSDSVHDFDHVLRVLALAERIGQAEGANLEVVRAAALLHDVGREQAEAAGLDHAAFAANRTREILVILVELSGVAPDAAHTTAFFDDRFFDTTAPSVSDFYTENSYGIFTYVPGDVLGWYANTHTPAQFLATNGHYPVFQEAIGDVDPDFNFECRRCGHCCSLYSIPCTDKDVQRILSYLMYPLEKASDFIELVEPEDYVMESYEDVPKVLIKDFDSENIVLVLKSDIIDKYCYFFNQVKCSIYPARPLVCRFFPIVYEYEDGSEAELIERPEDIKFSVFEEGKYCKGMGQGKEFEFDKLREITVQTIKEDIEYKNKVNTWNIRVIFNQIKEWDEEHFLKYILNSKD